MIAVISLLHRVGMSSMLGRSVSCKICLASEIVDFSGGGEGRSLWCWDLAYCCPWAEFLRLARRCICLASDFVIGGRSFFGSVSCVCLAIGYIVCACLWYVLIIVMAYFAALSMCVGVVSFEAVSVCN